MALITTENVTKSFTGSRTVLRDVCLEVREGEVLALLGKSGSGKSTLLRTLAGLVEPSGGRVTYRGNTLSVGMVFQNFALLPWLTVRENVELGLRAKGLPVAERRRRAAEAIDLIGLDGFETAYPKELSGGMRQRVGFARALVLEPDALLMDEPFSALDVLTAENLRGELMSLWTSARFPTKAMCLVTHNIEEAVAMADRIVVLGDGRISLELTVPLARPRDRRNAAFTAIVDQIYTALMGQTRAEVDHDTPLRRPLPPATVGGLAGLIELLGAHGGRTDLHSLAAALTFAVDDLLPLVDAASLLGLVEVAGAELLITGAGEDWLAADIPTAKSIFARRAVASAPLVRVIADALRTSRSGRLRDEFFLDLLRTGFPEPDAQRQLATAVDWGRYGELFSFDAVARELVLEE
ncbi:nitrate/sulfonate/bicarbonate ABC transporter ATP-binding protein [Allokutzneria sp. A3M-2-11 16]|uniref:ABC transporter ATP-binding protein n=1 Tax=Allokutzneria sp. A3M-2-11 16 TaxID=2962043 RepID=UPI0020B7449E|nr:nitrate/sulfonate/bicarbonate ABC transporter ATP-binding protein [Allokutzneria sp. A3M-2-11 16]MCP3798578.1 nitrate/sulfonate/bicarbonate ABC transporter ATP-binding protein [Allokutzneria sp. A3M-2-11 16]